MAFPSEHLVADVEGLRAAAQATDCRDVYLRADGWRLVCALGIEGLAVIDTPDALLAAPFDRTQEVKGVVGALVAAGRTEATPPARVHRLWGWRQTMDLGGRFRVKRIRASLGRKLSLQKRHHRAERWVVVKGAAEVTRDGAVLTVCENESVYLPGAASTVWSIPAGFRSRSSRCRPGRTSRRTTSSASRTISARG